jgi:4-hydroxybenzoate polyprenyltransferase
MKVSDISGAPEGRAVTQAGGRVIALIEALRPKQWTKNAVVFAALVFDGRLFQLPDFLTVLMATILFALTSSAGYLINDLKDVDADRQHPKKRLRPIASGRLETQVALAAAVTIYALALPLAFLLSPAFAAVLLTYVVLMFAYNGVLKHWVIVDVFVIAAGFVLRVIAGAVVIGVPISPWLYVCTILLSLFIGFGKRRNELSLLEDNATNHRRNLDAYSLALLDQFILIVASATVISYSLYTFYAPRTPDSNAMMLTIPFVLYGVFRYLYLVHRKGSGGAPEQVVLEDRPLLLTLVLWGALAVVILYGPWT